MLNFRYPETNPFYIVSDMQNIANCIRNCELLASLNDDDIQKLSEIGSSRTYKKNTIILSAGDTTDSIYVIDSGKVRVFRDNDEGRQIILNTLESGDMFGELAALSGSPRTASIETVESTKVLVIEKVDFLDMLGRNPQISIALCGKFAELVQVMADHMAELALLDVYGRLTNLFQRNAVEIDGKKVVHGFTHQELANSVGASREMISRIISGLKKGNYISSIPENRDIVIERKLPSGW